MDAPEIGAILSDGPLDTGGLTNKGVICAFKIGALPGAKCDRLNLSYGVKSQTVKSRCLSVLYRRDEIISQ